MDEIFLNSFHLDILKEIGNIGAGNAATALAKMLDKKVNMEVPQIKIMGFSEVSEVVGGAETPVAGILLGIRGDISGYILFVLEEGAAKKLINMLMGKNPDEEVEYNEITLSALKEVGNILTGSYLSAISTLTGLSIKPDIPDIAIDMAGAILSVPAIEFAKTTDKVLYIETEFIEGMHRVIGDFFLVPDTDSYLKLLNSLGAIC
ncbi:CheY-P phosphatase CheC [Thermoclostridium stercorarium subsp. stercorarium DSM 8532]|jgi:chemotaxis protein CheC|uniref:CheY-P phosphatase CheC n=3 Tax=Thermoclostridium stercorarium TaxID=1510 RepID=L7VLX2_THES1|nr:chemotaxis protein CheC [Thermoclostridium stercorarium]AGC67727.1 CheY-P phosphatase CheC [Thermoclostridium stercorarium subsp. stercorarium DSM 8532]AGI38778.1 CheC [Thermoclostridium stercorarium subsp. stercorarium DSM 8532]ANW98141.1 CheY-P-specific phosphatase CheC [Thermoclostridium stercorarium subsp. thermolacticum DSM 2910]ANX00680.1 CheY-P-specific phosphatase CheC [Thermoclostridium stercorarium subsp. leptospartum DSM 9219]UZQ86296.1 chemotaxis protein CheC [Thermoclostridium 